MQDGAYIVKLLDMFDLCELGEDPATLHKFFDIFYALGNVSFVVDRSWCWLSHPVWLLGPIQLWLTCALSAYQSKCAIAAWSRSC